MSLFNIITNTVTGVVQVAVNTVKVIPAGIIAPMDDGKAIADAAKGIVSGVEKIGKAEQANG